MMWAHYADKYKGVVFQFRCEHLNDTATGTFKGREVFYFRRRVDLADHVAAMKRCFDDGHPEDMGWVFCVKGPEWSGEEEVRFFAPTEISFLSFPEKALTGIILGEHCPPKVETELRTTVEDWQKPPRFFRTSIDRSIFRLHIRGIDHEE